MPVLYPDKENYGYTPLEQLKELFESSVSAKDAMDQFFKDLHDGLFICSTEPGLALEIFQRRSDYILEKKHPSDMRARI